MGTIWLSAPSAENREASPRESVLTPSCLVVGLLVVDVDENILLSKLAWSCTHTSWPESQMGGASSWIQPWTMVVLSGWGEVRRSISRRASKTL